MARTVRPRPRVYGTYILYYVQTFIRINLGKKLNIKETAVKLIIMANKTSSGLKKQLNSLNFKCQTKSKLHKPLIRPIRTY